MNSQQTQENILEGDQPLPENAAIQRQGGGREDFRNIAAMFLGLGNVTKWACVNYKPPRKEQ